MTPKRSRTEFVCQECGFRSPVWSGRCPSCSRWNTLVEELVAGRGSAGPGARECVFVPPAPIESISSEEGVRLETGIAELDRVLGGGAFSGSINLVGGEPGIGKSTLMLQLAGKVASMGSRVLYATGEESAGQVADRAARLGVGGSELLVMSATSLPDIETALEDDLIRVLILDSIQTVFSPELSSSPGSVSQVRHCAGEILRHTKARDMTTFLVGHVTKEGAIAGPKVLEHLVDAVIYFEGDGRRSYRLLRAVKNRFGATNELGVFEMTSSGLKGVADASGFFLQGGAGGVDGRPASPGTAIAAVMEGTRPFLVEIQSLTTPARYGYPQRSVSGFDSKRLPLLLAVLEKRCGLDPGSQDVYVNVAGGVRIEDPGADLAVCLAVASSLRDRPVASSVAVAGEVGLGGELRAVSHIDWRLKESLNLGFRFLACASCDTGDGHYRGFESLSTAMAGLLDGSGSGGDWI